MAGLTAGVIQAQKELREAGAAAYPSGIPVVHGVAAVGGVGEWATSADSEDGLAIISARVLPGGQEIRIQLSTWMVASASPSSGWTFTSNGRNISISWGLVFGDGITLFTSDVIGAGETVLGSFNSSTGIVTRFPIERNLASTSFAIENASQVTSPEPLSASVGITGRVVTVPFSESLGAYTSGLGISLTGACFVSCSTSVSTLTIVVSGVLPGEAVSVSYDAGVGSLAGSSGVPVSSFGPVAATNNSALSGSVAALLNFNAANGSTTFDDAVDPLNWTRQGSAVISTAASRFGGSSALFGSSTDALYMHGSAANYAAVTGLSNLARSFTIQCWVNPNASGSTRYIFTTKANEPNKAGMSLYMSSGDSLAFTVRSATGSVALATGANPAAFTAGTWRHVAVCYNHLTETATCHVDGVPVSSASKPGGGTWGTGSTPEISTYGSGGSGSGTLYGMNAYLDDFRIDLDVVRYPHDATFVPPTYQLALPA